MDLLIQKAAELAWRYHKDQIRKGDDSPYIIHPIMVATILAKYRFDDVTIAAGFCHDLLEDTKCSEKEIKNACGEKVLEIVKAVTNDPDFSDKKDWEKKKLKYIETVRKGSIEAKAVCTADKIHNVLSTLEAYPKQGPSFWNRFNRGREKKERYETEVLKMLKETWDHPLIREYEKLLTKVRELK